MYKSINIVADTHLSWRHKMSVTKKATDSNGRWADGRLKSINRMLDIDQTKEARGVF